MALTIAKVDALRIQAYRELGFEVMDANGRPVPVASRETLLVVNRFAELVGYAIIADLEAQIAAREGGA